MIAINTYDTITIQKDKKEKEVHMGKIKYTILVPAYNEEETVNAFYDAITPVMEKVGESYEVLFINDGSRDKTEQLLNELSEKDKHIKAVHFSRNFGQQAAFNAGFHYAKGDAIVMMDCDLQDPVEVLPEMFEKWKEGYDIVHGRRTVRHGESFFKKITSSIYMRFLKKVTGLSVPKNVGEFKLMDRKVVDAIISMPEKNLYLRGLTAWMGYKQTFVDFERQERVAGTTKFNFKKLVKTAMNGVVADSTYPLTLPMKFGIWGGVLSTIAFITFIVLACVGLGLPLVAWLFPTITMVASIMCVLQGCTNIYITQIYKEVKARPVYLVRETKNIEE